MNKGKKKLIIVLAVIAFFLLFNAVFWISPDLILLLRNWLKNINPQNTIFNNIIDDKTYLSVILNPLFSFTAIAISFLALMINKSSNKMRSKEVDTQIRTAATYIHLSIEHSSSAVYDLHKNYTRSDETIIDRISFQEAAYLYANEKITQDEYSVLRDYLNDISWIINSQGQAEKQSKIDDFYKKYFKNNSIEKIDELNSISNKMKDIIERK